MTKPRARWAVPALVGWVAVLTVLLQAPVAARAALVVVACAWAPGAAVAWLLETKDTLERAVLTVALSLGITTIETVTLSLLHMMTGVAALTGLAELSSLVLVLRLVWPANGPLRLTGRR